MGLNWKGDELNRLYSTELNNIANMSRIGVLSGCEVTPTSPSSMDVEIAAGETFFLASQVLITGGSVTIDANTSQYNRIDIIALKDDDTITVIKGTPRELVMPPEYDAEVYLPIALIFISNTTTAIELINIRDIRAVNTLNAGGGGEPNTASNVGTGEGEVYKEKNIYDLRLKTIKAGSNITVTNNIDDITITGSATGENNTASNVGTGEGLVYKEKSGIDLRLKSIKAGLNITVTNNTDDITITGAASASQLTLIPNVATDLTGNGIVSTQTAGENLAISEVVYLEATGKMKKAKADAESTARGKLVMVTATILNNASGVCLEYGYFRNDTWNWTPGGLIYLSAATAGALTQTAPSTATNIVRIVGYAYSADIICFNPDTSFVEI